jgi:guanosine-3',5'-bis(diphosphate) 3'-pyrophosphohydrolase
VDERIFLALSFAAEKHKGHRRKGGRDIPYINHPIGVAALLATVGGVTDPDILAAAFLHDTVEDTDTTPEELESLFGPVIAGLVAEVTDDPAIDSETRKVVQERDAPFKTHKARLIRLADKTCNIYDIAHAPPPNWSIERRLAYFDWAERVVNALGPTHDALEAEFKSRLAAARALVQNEQAAQEV